jgi:hypothetical protein
MYVCIIINNDNRNRKPINIINLIITNVASARMHVDKVRRRYAIRAPLTNVRLWRRYNIYNIL